MSETKTAVKRQKIGPWQEAWLQTLESGELKRTASTLCKVATTTGEYSFCCLGVACEVYIQNGGRLKVKQSNRAFAYGGEMAYMPERVKRAMKFHAWNGNLREHLLPTGELRDAAVRAARGRCSLVSMNDNGWSFKRIAAFVRKYPEAVFSGPA